MRDGLKELSFYRHRVHVRIEGFRTDKLIDRAFRKGIALKNVRIISETEAEAQLAAKELKTLKKLAKSVYLITVIHDEGAETKLKTVRRQPLWLVGIMLTAAVIVLRASFVTSIVVDGYRAIPEQSLRQCLNEAGIYEGVYRPSVNWDKARSSLYKTFPQISWLKLVYDGRTVYLDISESESGDTSEAGESTADSNGKEGDSKALDHDSGSIPNSNAHSHSGFQLTYTDLVAICSGYVESIDPLWGEARVEPGDYVKKGQVLIAGCIPIEPTTFEENAPKEYYVRAKGEVWARVPYRLNFAQERYSSEPQEDEMLIVNKRERTTDEVKSKAEQQIRLWAKENLPENAEILNKSLNFTPKENIIEVGVTLEVRREISEEQEITVGQEISDIGGD